MMMSKFALAAVLVVTTVAVAVSAMPVRSILPHAKPPAGYVAVPGSKLAHKSCVHRVPSESVATKDARTGEWVLTNAAAGTSTRLPKCGHALYRRNFWHSGVSTPKAPQHGPAWIVDAMQDDAAGNGFNLFAANWTVPPAPTNTNDGTLLYYWIGTESEQEGDVVQPVLQFGVGPYGGGNYWLFQSWFVSGDGTVLVGDQTGAIQPGTAVWGSITKAADGSQYTSTAVAPGVSGSPSVLSVSASETALQTRAYVTVEVYNIDASDCTVLPPSNHLAFTEIDLHDGNNKPVTPKFTAETQHQVCQHSLTIAGDSVTINWQS